MAVPMKSSSFSKHMVLPFSCNLPIEDLTGAIKLDKKNLNNHLNVVLLHTIGDSYVYPTDVTFFDNAGIM